MDRLVEASNEKDSWEEVSIVARMNDRSAYDVRRTESAVRFVSRFSVQDQRLFSFDDLTQGLKKRRWTQSMDKIVYKKFDLQQKESLR